MGVYQSIMKIKGIIDEDFVNYKKPSMFIAFPMCSFKCDRENGGRVCQNSALASQPDIKISVDELCQRYLQNPISKAIVCGGLEPFDSVSDLLDLIFYVRRIYFCEDDIVIYTGYTEQEIRRHHCCAFDLLHIYKNIIVKFGRYIPGQEPHYDETLGVKLASDNQYARILCSIPI